MLALRSQVTFHTVTPTDSSKEVRGRGAQRGLTTGSKGADMDVESHCKWSDVEACWKPSPDEPSHMIQPSELSDSNSGF